ncbi:hypothetical protein COCC4DRAFT_155935 [Bipolaris maydis ATCC 48331]|uniref:F-box domain-containing protein n=2 Tax=Cochliobolus heterostrophus TaxID=5016 RepID=M2UA78_COCH5|nr:uncharacterized protein COCC4DRAFT_155935 [Bipolaris maydis ATCC 48331]EMD95504.1 hypothetical protein COCHEDRAFT_1126247 [Bipolaris maydis C5]KAJ5030269.1 hypothetical protein J3E73DRAFT_225280 [Bipolaris maydis]ENI10368.1 hypothetical protein COCC4DRAFT_155935 [Bipolaris maydis ATCC 48331]KAJ5041361.1 hypothetical protein J3E74DRAFT_257827 [Bipolaris maydis]KAJ5065273.1 hypothetical protein J3E74DRAFT_233457 [Bipolaris maydis]
MAPPSYARATASSTSKASPNPKTPTSLSKANNSTPTSQEKKKALKRPSTLTSHQKDTITYKRDLYHITPKDASKPCFLSLLPSELRTQIYTYILPTTHYISPSWPSLSKPKHHAPPSLLHISRAIRIEAAYTYYTTTTFHFTVRNLDFSPVTRWLEDLAPHHRALLPRNHRGLSINVIPAMKNMFTYPPKGWLLDANVEHHWRACQPFGNIYTVHGEAHKMHFVIFCRLAEWWRRWGALQLKGEVKCNYAFEQSPFANPFGIPDFLDEVVLRMFLRHHACVVGMSCVDKAWRRNRRAAGMKDEGVRFLEALDTWYRDRWGKQGGVNEWNVKMEEAKKAIGRW